VGGLDEHFLFMGMAREPVIFQAVSRAVPHVGAVRLTEGGCAWLHGVVSIRKQHQGDGKNAIMAAFGAHTSMKRVVIVDEDINVFDDRDVEWAIATRFQADRGLVVLHDVRGSSIDPSGRDGFTSKMGIDATKPLGGNRATVPPEESHGAVPGPNPDDRRRAHPRPAHPILRHRRERVSRWWVL